MTKKDIEEKLNAVIYEQLDGAGYPPKPDARFREDMGADELDILMLVMEAEDEFSVEISDDDVPTLATPALLAACVAAKLGVTE